MKNKSNKIFIIFIIIIVFIAIAIVFLILNKDNNLLKTIFNNKNGNQETNVINDSHNGVYKYKKEIGQTFSIYRGCTLTSLDQYIVVVNEDYYIYDSTCMGTFLKGSGKSSELKFEEDSSTKRYKIKKDSIVYYKDNTSYEFKHQNKVKDKFDNTFNFNSFNLIMSTTQLPDEYYGFYTLVSNLNRKYRFIVEPSLSGYFDISIKYNTTTVYNKSFVTLDQLPKFSTFTTSNVIVLEKDHVYNKYSNRLKLVSEDGIKYDSDLLFPIKIQNVELNTNNSIFIKYDSRESKYRVLIGYDDKFCREDDNSKEIVNYEFTISFDYANRSFTNLEFVRIGYANEGCKHVESILEENIW